MPDQIIPKEAVAARAEEAYLGWLAGHGVGTPQNPYPALSAAARLFDSILQRHMQGGEPGDAEGAA